MLSAPVPVQVHCERFYIKPYNPFIHVSIPVSVLALETASVIKPSLWCPYGWLFQPHLRVTLIVFNEKVSLASLQHCRSVDADAWCKRVLKYTTFILLVPGIQSVSVPGQLVYLSEERVAFHNVPMYSRARRMFVMTNQSTEHTTHFEWHVTSLKDSQVHIFFHYSKRVN